MIVGQISIWSCWPLFARGCCSTMCDVRCGLWGFIDYCICICIYFSFPFCFHSRSRSYLSSLLLYFYYSSDSLSLSLSRSLLVTRCQRVQWIAFGGSTQLNWSQVRTLSAARIRSSASSLFMAPISDYWSLSVNNSANDIYPFTEAWTEFGAQSDVFWALKG